MLRKKETWVDVACNWVMLLSVVMPLAVFGLIGILSFIFWILGVRG